MGEVLPAPAFLAVDAAFAVAVALVYRRIGAWRAAGDRAAAALAVAGVGLCALVGVVGPPTAREPIWMLLNAVVLLAVAVALLAAAVRLALRVWDSGAISARFPAVLALLALGVPGGAVRGAGDHGADRGDQASMASQWRLRLPGS